MVKFDEFEKKRFFAGLNHAVTPNAMFLPVFLDKNCELWNLRQPENLVHSHPLVSLRSWLITVPNSARSKIGKTLKLRTRKFLVCYQIWHVHLTGKWPFFYQKAGPVNNLSNLTLSRFFPNPAQGLPTHFKN